MTGTLQPLDQLVVGLYLFAILVVSGVIARKQRTGADYFLARRSMSGAKLSMSIVANQVSAVGLISAPAFVALHAGGGLRWLQYELAVPLAMLLLIGLLLPALRSVPGASIYELAERRFGRRTRQVLAATFLLSRGLALGVILYTSAVVIAVVFDVSINLALILVGVSSIAYTTLGGIVADIWTDIIQLAVLWSGVLSAALFILYRGALNWNSIPPARIRALVLETGGLRGNDDFSFWPMLVGGLFLYVSYYGCDPSQAQRLLAAKSEAEARRALILNALLRFPLVLTYCGFGLLLAVLLHSDPAFASAVSYGPIETLVPQFVLMYLPTGLRGLFVTAIFAAAMSSIDSSMNSLAAVTLEDVFGQPPERQSVWLSRAVSLAWGIFALLAGILFTKSGDSIITLMNRIGSAFSGPILALFVLAVVGRNIKSSHAILGLLGGLTSNLLLGWWFPSVSWLWWNPSGFIVACALAILTSRTTLQVPPWACPERDTKLLIGLFLCILFLLAIAF